MHEDDGTTAHLILPLSEYLTEAELAQAAGARRAIGPILHIDIDHVTFRYSADSATLAR